MADEQIVHIAIVTEAPVPGVAKKRCTMALGVDGAAKLQRRLIERAIAAAKQAALGPITLWGMPHVRDAVFAELAARHAVIVKPLPAGMGIARLAVALADATPALVFTADCPVLDAAAIRAAGDAILRHSDAVLGPSEDGRCLLFAARGLDAAVLALLDRSRENDAASLRACLRGHEVRVSELPPRWSVERPSDLRRLREKGFAALVEGLRREVPSMMAARG